LKERGENIKRGHREKNVGGKGGQKKKTSRLKHRNQKGGDWGTQESSVLQCKIAMKNLQKEERGELWPKGDNETRTGGKEQQGRPF